MWTEEELPEGDLRSVYGDAAWLARLHATVNRLVQKDEKRQRRLDEALLYLEQLSSGEKPQRK